MADLLGDHERKRGRAMHHFNILRKQVEGFNNVDRKPVRGEFDRDAAQYVFKVPMESFDPDWNLVVGDFAYNTRASLDYLITALILSTGKKENKTSQFPIHTPGCGRVTWENFNQWWETGRVVNRQLQDTPTGTKAALKDLQPFDGIPRLNPFHHPLFALNVLNNRDKHRRLNLLTRSLSFNFVDAYRKPLFQGPPIQDRMAETTEDDTYTVTLTVGIEYADMDMYLLPALYVALDEGPWLNLDLIETLTGINQFIDRRVLPTVKRLLP